MNNRLLLVTATALLSGCAATQQSNSVSNEQLDQALSSHSEQLIVALNDNHNDMKVQQQALLEQIAGLEAQLSSLKNSRPAKEKTPTATPIPKCEPVVVNSHDDKMVFGEAEEVSVPFYERVFNARVDTGATSTSMVALNIEEFERDGDDWVRFELPADGDKKTKYEAKVERAVEIKKASEDANIRRPVIKVKLEIGNYSGETDVNLSDRSHMEFPLLLGRNFFKDIAIVDVSRKYVQKNWEQ